MEQHQGQKSPRQNEREAPRSGAPTGFEGMNFEEQRASYKNSDGGGHSYSREESQRERNGRNAPEQ